MIDTPNINIQKKTNEENMQSVKSWGVQVTEQMQYMQNQIDALKDTVSTLQSQLEGDGN